MSCTGVQLMATHNRRSPFPDRAFGDTVLPYSFKKLLSAYTCDSAGLNSLVLELKVLNKIEDANNCENDDGRM